MASDIFFTTNPSEFTKLEGLYINEKDPPGFIRGADLSRVGVGGTCVRGPAGVQQIGGSARFLEIYGGRDDGAGGPLIGEIWASLLNKPMGAISVARLIAADAVVASLNVEVGVDGAGLEVATIAASSPGAWGAQILQQVEDATDEDATHWNLRVKYLGGEALYENIDTSNGVSDQSAVDAIIGDDIARLIDITVLAAGRPNNGLTVTEVDWVAARDADGFVTLVVPGAAWTGVAGSDGTIVTADEIALVTTLANAPDVAIVNMVGIMADHNAMNGQVVTDAALVSDRVFLVWAGTHSQDVATEVANVSTDITTRSDRIIWCFNSANTTDPDTRLAVLRSPNEWMASVLSQNDVDIHPGARQTADQTAGIRSLDNEVLTRQNLIDLRNAGACTLEKLRGMFLFRSGVTTLLTTGKTEITRRRSTDFLQLSAADKLVEFVKAKNTQENRATMAGLLVGFSQSLRDKGRIIEEFAVDQESVNTDNQRAQGIEKILWRIRMIGHILHLVLETEIGTGVVIEST